MSVKHYPHVLDPADPSVPHDPNGPDIQTHEVGDEMWMTFSEKIAEDLDWQPGDTIIWKINEDTGEISLEAPQAEVRKALRRKVDEMLGAGYEL